MTTNNNFTENKTIEETAHDIGVAVGKGAEKACSTVKAFGEGIKKGIDDNRPLNEKVEDARETVIKGVKEGTEKVGKTAEAFGDGIKKELTTRARILDGPLESPEEISNDLTTKHIY